MPAAQVNRQTHTSRERDYCRQQKPDSAKKSAPSRVLFFGHGWLGWRLLAYLLRTQPTSGLGKVLRGSWNWPRAPGLLRGRRRRIGHQACATEIANDLAGLRFTAANRAFDFALNLPTAGIAGHHGGGAA